MAVIMINISGKEVADSVPSPKTKRELYALVKGHDVILQVGSDTKFDRILNAFWQTLAYASSFRVSHEDLGGLFEIVSERDAMNANRPKLVAVK